MPLPQCQIVVYPYGNESVTSHMLDAVIDDTRGTNLITRAAVEGLQDLDRWLVSSSGDADASVELQVQILKGSRICAERFTASDTAPAGLPRGCGIVVGRGSSIHRDFHQQGYPGLPMVYPRPTRVSSICGSRRQKGTPNHHGTKTKANPKQYWNGVQDDPSDTRNRGEKAGMNAPLEPTAEHSKWWYFCRWCIRRFSSPSPCQRERGDEPSRSDFRVSGCQFSYLAGGGELRLPVDRVVRRGAPLNKPAIAPRNVKPAQRILPVTQTADSVLDILIWKADYSQIRRFLVLEFDADVNIMDDEVFRSLKLEKEPCDMTVPLSLPGRAHLKPIGKVNCRWCVWGNTHSYLTSFLIVSGCDFDVMIGRQTIKELEIYA
ncbi:uncharacterized protein BDW47DRAFT_128463 [Aspergillus candidus]|uniref:Uncharacterized protein n=1 Tax=Aspergillus candidus TaxID=41067 RepID=A0A2I2F3D4_ASPCN|nr:hypothetical protein BDW47DRAFT_128463 [Aspergillus candidus]PLB35141.1 hypothetical protein BDW47DRAFT_128463 [Aspergillus candidus]